MWNFRQRNNNLLSNFKIWFGTWNCRRPSVWHSFTTLASVKQYCNLVSNLYQLSKKWWTDLLKTSSKPDNHSRERGAKHENRYLSRPAAEYKDSKEADRITIYSVWRKISKKKETFWMNIQSTNETCKIVTPVQCVRKCQRNGPSNEVHIDVSACFCLLIRKFWTKSPNWFLDIFLEGRLFF